MKLSKHFTLEEMTRSMTAARKGINNIPGPGEIKNLGDLCYEVLEPVRAHFDKPLSISSVDTVQRALCEAIGSKKTSQHALGRGGRPRNSFGVANNELADWIKEQSNDFDQCNFRILHT